MKHQKHNDILDVQLRTRFLDMYGNEMAGVIEYDPQTGQGKRIALGGADKGLIEGFIQKGGFVELDGQTFSEDNDNDPDTVEAIKTVISMKINRNKDPQIYEDEVKHHAELNKKARQEAQQTQARLVSQIVAEPSPITMVAAETIRPGDKIMIDSEGAVRKFKDNIHHADQATRQEREAKRQPQETVV